MGGEVAMSQTPTTKAAYGWVACPHCHVGVGEFCRQPDGRRYEWMHKKRMMAARGILNANRAYRGLPPLP